MYKMFKRYRIRELGTTTFVIECQFGHVREGCWRNTISWDVLPEPMHVIAPDGAYTNRVKVYGSVEEATPELERLVADERKRQAEQARVKYVSEWQP